MVQTFAFRASTPGLFRSRKMVRPSTCFFLLRPYTFPSYGFFWFFLRFFFGSTLPTGIWTFFRALVEFFPVLRIICLPLLDQRLAFSVGSRDQCSYLFIPSPASRLPSSPLPLLVSEIESPSGFVPV